MSQYKPEETVIEGTNYLMYLMPPKQSYRLLMKVVKMIGPAIGPVLDTALSGRSGSEASEMLDKEVGPEFFANAAGALFENLDQSVFDQVVYEFSTLSEVEGKPLDKIFDDHFLGSLDQMFRWLAWGMSVQWGKSWSALVSGIKTKRPRPKEESPSPKDSTG